MSGVPQMAKPAVEGALDGRVQVSFWSYLLWRGASCDLLLRTTRVLCNSYQYAARHDAPFRLERRISSESIAAILRRNSRAVWPALPEATDGQYLGTSAGEAKAKTNA